MDGFEDVLFEDEAGLVGGLAMMQFGEPLQCVLEGGGTTDAQVGIEEHQGMFSGRKDFLSNGLTSVFQRNTTEYIKFMARTKNKQHRLPPSAEFTHEKNLARVRRLKKSGAADEKRCSCVHCESKLTVAVSSTPVPRKDRPQWFEVRFRCQSCEGQWVETYAPAGAQAG